jgi:ABC-type branched-subunit amino acid transport system substrate-binding protein
MSPRLARTVAMALLVLALATLTACGKTSSSGGGQESAGGVKAGPGVTDKTITLGVQTDLTGTFAALGEVVTQSDKLYWDQQNKAGGVCGREVKLVVKDHGYDPQTAVTQYRDISADVAALQQVIGSPVSAALLPTWEKDHMLALLAAWPPSLLNHDEIGVIGPSYDVEAINGIEWMMQNKGLKEGDTIGDLYFEGDYGEGGLIGVKHAADAHNLKVVEQKIKATDTDMSAAASAFKRAGVKAIWVTVGPKQLASLAGVAQAQGLQVPIGGNGPVFSPLLLDTAVAATLEKNLTVFTGTAPISLSGNPAIEKALAAYKAAYPKGVPQQAVVTGFAEGEVMKATLEKACASKDLTRENIVKSFRTLAAVDTGGFIAEPLDFSKVGQPSAKAVYALKIDKGVVGGERALGKPYLSATAKTYEVTAGG